MFLCGSKPSVFILCFPERLYYFNFKGAISPQRMQRYFLWLSNSLCYSVAKKCYALHDQTLLDHFKLAHLLFLHAIQMQENV